MLTVEEALKVVLERARPLPPRRVPLAEALGCVLAEDVVADIDSPPFDKALMDGYAVRAADCRDGPPFRLRLGEEIPAGRTPSRPLGPDEAATIMTGAPLPEGADAVVMIEQTRLEGPFLVIEAPVRPGQNWMERGREMRAGEIVLHRDNRPPLDPVGLALLASVGCVRPLVSSCRPLVRIVSTGDELIEPDGMPGPGQIRNSNATLLWAMVDRCRGARAEVSPIAPDEPVELRERLVHGLEADVLLITGGVSAGKRDLVPGTLAALGVETVFHKVRLKPGKPLLFGIGPARSDGSPGALVFGLPGNPVSALVGFLLFVDPAIGRLRGVDIETAARQARPFGPLPLARPFSHRGDRPTYHPAKGISPVIVNGTKHGYGLLPLEWAGSPDLRTVAAADYLAVFPAGDRDYAVGEEVGFLFLWE
jgi:molybdopterin molybdotransferase